MNEYDGKSTIELRALVRERGLAKGAAVASARKEDLIALLKGERVTLDSPALASSPVSADTLADVIAAAVSGRVKAGLDESAVLDVVQAWADAALPGMIAQHARAGGITINMPELPEPISMDGEPVHRQMPQILAWLRADVPVWLHGQPGGGKTHLGRQLAKALGIGCYTMSIDETTTANKLLGFQNLVSGDFVQGWLYEPYKNGGLVVIDEIDTGNPGILAGLNALVSNGHYLFPNGETVEKHPSFRVLACANTKGTGAVAGYTARQRLDAATLNRFAIIEFQYDAGLEMQIACGIPSDSTPWQPGKPATPKGCERWVRWVQSVREKVGRNVLVSPRPSLLGVRALRAGIQPSDVANALVFALCADDTITAIKEACGDPKDMVVSHG